MSGKILWCGVARKNEKSITLLAEAGEDNFDGELIKLARKLLNRKPTGGWEFERSRAKKLRGVNFYVHESQKQTGDWEQQPAAPTIWVFSAVAESSLDEKQQKSFLEKLVYLTEPCR